MRRTVQSGFWFRLPVHAAAALSAVALLWPLLHAIQVGPVPERIIGISAATIIASAVALSLWNRYLRSRLAADVNARFPEAFGPLTVSLSKDGIEYRTDRVCGLIPWPQVRDVEDFERGIVIGHGPWFVLRIPVDAFPDDASRLQFRQAIMQRISSPSA